MSSITFANNQKGQPDGSAGQNEVTLNLGNNDQVDRLISAVKGLSHQQLVIKWQEPLPIKLKDSPQVGKLIKAIEGLSSQQIVIKQETPQPLKLELQNNPQVDRLIRAVETRSPQYPVTEQRLASYIAGKTACGKARFEMSDFIRFGWKKSKLDEAAKKQIAGFMERNRQARKLWVFGFTSPDGKEGHNKELAKKRVQAVVDKIKTEHSYHGDISTNPIGENHPINGVADSRSVVIAACRGQPDETETGSKPDTTAPSCAGAN